MDKIFDEAYGTYDNYFQNKFSPQIKSCLISDTKTCKWCSCKLFEKLEFNSKFGSLTKESYFNACIRCIPELKNLLSKK